MFLAECRHSFLHVFVSGFRYEKCRVTPDRLEAVTDVAGSQLPSSGDCSPDSAIAVGAVQPASPS
jgi:hypothetical protein